MNGQPFERLEQLEQRQHNAETMLEALTAELEELQRLAGTGRLPLDRHRAFDVRSDAVQTELAAILAQIDNLLEGR